MIPSSRWTRPNSGSAPSDAASKASESKSVRFDCEMAMAEADSPPPRFRSRLRLRNHALSRAERWNQFHSFQPVAALITSSEHIALKGILSQAITCVCATTGGLVGFATNFEIVKKSAEAFRETNQVYERSDGSTGIGGAPQGQNAG
jgi:hypothetical protein